MTAIYQFPTRQKLNAPAKPFLPYGRQVIEKDDIEAVVEVLSADMLTTGPMVEQFERALADIVGAREAIACSNGTAALYLAAKALGLGPGSTVIVPSITFLATASAPHLAGAGIVFADVDPHTGLMDAKTFEEALSRCPNGRADAVFPVHYAGQACDMQAIAKIARSNSMRVVEDAAHALGTAWDLEDDEVVPVGSNRFADLTTFSFHPVKTVAMGEGGAVTAEDEDVVKRLKQMRNHGLTREAEDFQRHDAALASDCQVNPWYYELHAAGLNFRVSDINCALGLSQLRKLARFVFRRSQLVAQYDSLLAPLEPFVRPLSRPVRSATAWHIYPVRIDFKAAARERAPLMRALAADGIGTQVHYIPVHRQPYFAGLGGRGELPGADNFYAQTLTLPLHAAMADDDPERVVSALKRHLGL